MAEVIELRASKGQYAGMVNIPELNRVLRNLQAAAAPGAAAASETVVGKYTVAGTYNDFDLGTTVTVARFEPTLLTSVTGFKGGVDGRQLLVWNCGASPALRLRHEDSGSEARNRFNISSGGNIVVDPGHGAMFWYDSSSARWRVGVLT